MISIRDFAIMVINISVHDSIKKTILATMFSGPRVMIPYRISLKLAAS